MRRVLELSDHAAFHLAALRTVLVGGALALVMARWPEANFLLGLLATLGLAGAAAPPRTLRQGLFLLGCALLSGASLSLLGRTGPAALLCAALCIGLGMAHGALPLPVRAGVLLGGALAAYGASRFVGAFLDDPPLPSLPSQLHLALSGMGAGLIVSAAAVLRGLRVRIDPLDHELLALLAPPLPGDEIGELLDKVLSSYKEAVAALPDHPQACAAAEDLVKKIARFGRRWREIEEQARRSDPESLAARLADLEARVAAAKDEEVRAEYERAAQAVRAQLGALDEIRMGKERAVARLHHQVATLERLRLSALRHRSVSVDAGVLGDELRGVVEELGRAGQELDAVSEALSEIPA